MTARASAGLLVALCACAAPHDVDARGVLAVLRDPGPETSRVVYGLLRPAFLADAPMPAGARARFAFHAARLGHREEAERALAEERERYPESVAFVDALAAYIAEAR